MEVVILIGGMTAIVIVEDGDPGGIRTHRLLFLRQHAIPIRIPGHWSVWWDLNPRPHASRARGLPSCPTH